MGLPMDHGISDIHVPSGPTSVHQPQDSLDGLNLQQLISRKDNLEAELKALGAVLDSHGVTMQTSLTTFDGYPRSDIDVAQVRVTRARIINLRNDWKNLMDRIEKGLHDHHANLQTSETTKQESPSVQAQSSDAPSVDTDIAFAKVNSVESGSPAHEAGLKAGDAIRRFGPATHTNHAALRKVGEAVQQNLGRPIPVTVSRGSGVDATVHELSLTPRQNWGGRGTLGCHIVPIN